MAWKPTLLAVVVVVAAGVGVGVALDDDAETEGGATDTVTDARSPEPTATPTSEPAGDPFYVVEAMVSVGDDVTLESVGTRAALQRGPARAGSVTLGLYQGAGSELPAHYEAGIQVPKGLTTFRATIGFARGTPGHRARVEFRQDDIRGKVLETVRLPARGVASVDVPVSRTPLVVKLVPLGDTWRTDDAENPPRFVLARARFQ